MKKIFLMCITAILICNSSYCQLKSVSSNTQIQERVVFKGSSGFKQIPAIKYINNTYRITIYTKCYDKYNTNVTQALTANSEYVPVTFIFDEKKKIIDFLNTCINLFDVDKKTTAIYTLNIQGIGDYDVSVSFLDLFGVYVCDFTLYNLCPNGIYGIEKVNGYRLYTGVTTGSYIYVGKKKSWTEEMIQNINDFVE